MYKTNKTKKGFSIGEVMIAMFILVTGIIGAVFLSAKSTGQIGDSRNAIIAASLAQEGVELVRNVRDNSVTQETCNINGANNDERCTAFDAYAGAPGNAGESYGWPSLGQSGIGCKVDYLFSAGTSEVMECKGAYHLSQLYLNPQEGFYNHSGGGDDITPFNRVVYIDYFNVKGGAVTNIHDKTTAAKITSVVTWSKNDIELNNAGDVEKNCKIGKQCAYAQTTLTSWINYGEGN